MNENNEVDSMNDKISKTKSLILQFETKITECDKMILNYEQPCMLHFIF